MSGSVVVAGVGMVPFQKPSRADSYDVMARSSIVEALEDAGVDYARVEQAYAGYVYGDSTSGQRAIYGVGLSGIPVVNVNNNCSTGSSALWLARQAVENGAADCVLVVGFEQMAPGALVSHWGDRPDPFDAFAAVLTDKYGPLPEGAPLAPMMFGAAGLDHMDEFGVGEEIFAHIAVKARRHAAANPRAIFREALTLEEVLASPRVWGPLTRLQCCPPTCGAAAAVLCTEEFARRNGIDTTVVIRAQALVTDTPETFSTRDVRQVVGYGMSERASAQVYEASGVAPSDITVAEVHDCFTTNELISYEALGLTPLGTSEKFVLEGDNTYGGRVVVNPSGGLLSKGHPLGATGLAQCAELTWQLRGVAGARQVDDARLALQHNVGVGGACVVTLYERRSV